MKKNLIKTLVAVSILTCASASTVLAQDTSNGCGVGWQVSQKTSLLSSSVRSITNYFLPNSFSMTSGTSGCAKHDIVKNDEKAVEYAVNNYDTLIVEMAEGHGEYLDGFAQALGCDQSNYAAFQNLVQTRYSDLTKNSGNDGIDLYRAVRLEIQATPSLSAQCMPRV